MTQPRLTLLTASGCGLCDKLKVVLQQAGIDFGEMDIASLPDGEKWRPHLPVLLVDSAPVFRYKATATQVRRALANPLYRGFRQARLKREMDRTLSGTDTPVRVQ